MNLYKTLQDKRKNRKLFQTRQHKFYYANSHILEKINYFSNYFSKDDDFDVIRANILIHSLINKSEIEEAVQYAYKKCIEVHGEINPSVIKSFVEERIIDLPYAKDKDEKIYVPIFSRALNKIYRDEPEKLLEIPYSHLIKDFNESIVDCFEIYNFNLYNSTFTYLVHITTKDDVACFYDVDYQSIYFINKQGRLDAKICLFDKYLLRVDKNHMANRIEPIVNAYYENDKQKLLDELVKNNLISYFLFKKIKKQDEKIKNKKFR